MTVEEPKFIVGVYGSLREGLGNHQLLKTSKSIGDHITKPEFTMYDLGLFPGIVKKGFTSIKLELYEVNTETKRRLDQLEGYNKKDKPNSMYYPSHIATPHGNVIVYIYNDECKHQPIVESGDWLEYSLERNKIYK